MSSDTGIIIGTILGFTAGGVAFYFVFRGAKKKNITEGKALLLGFTALTIIWIIFIQAFKASSNRNSSPSASDTSQQTAAQTDEMFSNVLVSASQPRTNADVQTVPVVFTKNSNGYDWKRANLQSKRQFCITIAEAESKEFNHEFTSDFYFGALDNFYNSSDSKILEENIHQVIGMVTAVAINQDQ